MLFVMLYFVFEFLCLLIRYHELASLIVLVLAVLLHLSELLLEVEDYVIEHRQQLHYYLLRLHLYQVHMLGLI